MDSSSLMEDMILKQRTDRKMKILVVSFLLMGIMAGTLGCRAKEKELFSVQYFDVFDTVTIISGYAKNEEAFQKEMRPLYERLKEYHKKYDIYNDYEGVTNIKTINDNAGKQKVTVDDSIFDLLSLGKTLYEDTNGQVNIAMGSVLKIWHTYRNEGLEHPDNAKLPTVNELSEAAKHMDIKKLQLDAAQKTVYLEDEKMSLDVGAIAKGYAAEQLAEYAKELGIENLLISVGGNVVALGEKENQSAWKVGVQNPDETSDEPYCITLELKDKSLVTSGNYQRYYEVEGKRYHHIINPKTLFPADYFQSVSVLTEDSGIADAMSTALFNMSLEEGQSMVEQDERIEAVWILPDGEIVYSQGFPKE